MLRRREEQHEEGLGGVGTPSTTQNEAQCGWRAVQPGEAWPLLEGLHVLGRGLDCILRMTVKIMAGGSTVNTLERLRPVFKVRVQGIELTQSRDVSVVKQVRLRIA